MSLILYRVKDREIIPTDESKLEKNEIYIIVDKQSKRPKIWIWSGGESNMLDRYFAGVSATKIKSKQKLYGANVEVVESGNEPEQFPILSKDKILSPSIRAPLTLETDEETEPSHEAITQLEVEAEEKTADIEVVDVESKESVKSIETEPIKEKASKSIPPPAEQTDKLLQEKLKILLKELSSDLENMQNKIKIFLTDL